MVPVIELRLDFVARAAGAPGMFLAGVLGERVPALNHEVLNDPVKTGAVIKTFLGEFLKILDVFRGDVRIKFHHHDAQAGRDHGDIVGVRRGRRLVGRHGGGRGRGDRFFIGAAGGKQQGKTSGTEQIEYFHGREIFHRRRQKSRGNEIISGEAGRLAWNW